MRNFRLEKKKKEEKFYPHCLDCTARMKDTNLADMKVCPNPACEMYEVIVNKWSVWGEDE